MDITCKNCENKFKKAFQFCPYCGQYSGTSRLNLKQLLKEVWLAITNADRGIIRLFKELTYRPGFVAYEYIVGKRKKYFNPFSYLFLMVAIALFFILKFENLAVSRLDPMALSRLDSGDYDTGILRYSFSYFNIFILLMCPLNAVIIWLFYFKKGRNYAEIIVLSSYLSGQTMLFYCIVLIPFYFFPGIIDVLGIISGVILTTWYVLGILQFYNTQAGLDITKAIFTVIISQAISQQIIFLSYRIFNDIG